MRKNVMLCIKVIKCEKKKKISNYQSNNTKRTEKILCIDLYYSQGYTFMNIYIITYVYIHVYIISMSLLLTYKRTVYVCLKEWKKKRKKRTGHTQFGYFFLFCITFLHNTIALCTPCES